jgi:hypothetical protein
MIITRKILLIVILILFAGCENEEIISVDLDYEEYIVVQAELRADRFFPPVRFTRTLPLEIPYRIEDAELKNVTAYIRKSGVQIIPLIYTQEGLYRTLYEFRVREGETYELFADLDGKFIYSITKIPYNPEIIRSFYNPGDYSLNADIQVKSDEVYGALWYIAGSPPVRADDYFSVISGTSPGVISVRTSPLPEEFRSNIYAGKRYILVHALDKSFKEYFNTKVSGDDINDPFVQGGGEINWNVHGEKVIGLFIGVAPGTPQPVF